MWHMQRTPVHLREMQPSSVALLQVSPFFLKGIFKFFFEATVILGSK